MSTGKQKLTTRLFFVPTSGVWVRSSHDGNVEVLVEVLQDGNKSWKLVFEQPATDFQPGEGVVSHIIEPLGISNAKPDPHDDVVAEEQRSLPPLVAKKTAAKKSRGKQ